MIRTQILASAAQTSTVREQFANTNEHRTLLQTFCGAIHPLVKEGTAPTMQRNNAKGLKVMADASICLRIMRA